MTFISEHVINLQGYCRLCGKSTLPKERTGKEKLSGELFSVFKLMLWRTKSPCIQNICATPAGAFFIDANQKGLHCLSRSNHLLLMNIQRNMKFVIPKQQT